MASGEFKTKPEAVKAMRRLEKQLPHMKGQYRVMTKTRYIVTRK